MFSEWQQLDLKLCSKHYYKTNLLHQIVMPQISGVLQHNYSTITAGHADEQFM